MAKRVKIVKIAKKYDQHDTFKSIRKPMPPPSYAMDDGDNKRSKQVVDFQSEDSITSIDDLMHEATVACELRGHKLDKWDVFENEAMNKCILCGKDVQVIVNPRPNEIDIGGEAVALNCT